MKLLWICSALIVGNLIYQALFTTTPDYLAAMKYSYWQGSGVFVAWLMGGFQD